MSDLARFEHAAIETVECAFDQLTIVFSACQNGISLIDAPAGGFLHQAPLAAVAIPAGEIKKERGRVSEFAFAQLQSDNAVKRFPDRRQPYCFFHSAPTRCESDLSFSLQMNSISSALGINR